MRADHVVEPACETAHADLRPGIEVFESAGASFACNRGTPLRYDPDLVGLIRTVYAASALTTLEVEAAGSAERGCVLDRPAP